MEVAAAFVCKVSFIYVFMENVCACLIHTAVSTCVFYCMRLNKSDFGSVCVKWAYFDCEMEKFLLNRFYFCSI